MHRSLIIAFLVFSSLATGQVVPKAFDFSAEDDSVPHAIVPPDSVLRSLIEAAGGSPGAGAEDFSVERLPSPADGVDLYLGEGVHGLRGANICPFWLVKFDRHTAAARVIWTSGEHDVFVRYSSANQYPEIRTAKMSAIHIWTATYRFQNGRYIRTKASDEDIR